LDPVDRLEAIHLRRATVVEGRFDNRTADRDYAAAFGEAGLGEEGEEAESVAGRVRDSAVCEQLVAALDDWAAVTNDPKRQAWLLEAARRADPDPWRDRFRDPKVRLDRAALEALAGELLRDEAQLAKQNPQLLAALGGAIQSTNADSVPLLAAAQARHPTDFWLNFKLGFALARVRQWNEAVGYYRGALAVRPNSNWAHNNLGDTLRENKQLDEAIREFRTAIDLDPKYALAHNNLGTALRDKNQLDEAIREYRTAIGLDPKYAIAWMNRAVAYSKLGQYDKAIADYSRGLKLSPGDANVHNDLAWLLATCPDSKFRDSKRAVELAEKAIKLAPKEGDFWQTLGVAQYRAGDWKPALDALTKSMKLRKGGDGFDWFFLAMVHWQLGHTEEARKWHDQAVEWMDKNNPKNEELAGFRAEAEELLKIEKEAKPK
jgi:serine/threonine-protein kinase